MVSYINEWQREEEEAQKLNQELDLRVIKQTAELKHIYEHLLHTEKLVALGQLSASIAHEINNPIFGIRNVLKGIKSRISLKKDDSEEIGMAIRECDRIKNLIASLRDIHRPTSGVISPIDIHTTIDNILLLFKNEFKVKKITVKKQYASYMPKTLAIGDQIKQVILNMLNNAEEAIPKDGGTIKIKTENLNNEVAIHISDSGVGIKPGDINQIFEPFFCTKPAFKGSGLGLSISYGIINKHGGDIVVKSKPGEGTTFTITLPIKA